MHSIPHDAETEAQQRVRRVVLRAMATLLPPERDKSGQQPILSFVDRLRLAVLGPDPLAVSTVVDVMRRTGVSTLDIAEVYVPHVAEVLGQCWTADELDFRQVSIGAARLQFLLRQLDDDWAMAHPPRSNACPAFLIGVPEGVQHTLGASVVAGQLRHRGFSVHIDPEITGYALASQLQKQQYAGVLLSASGAAHLDSCRELVATCKKESMGTPVILGGTILGHHDSIIDRTEADCATSDISEALTFCGFDGTRLFDPQMPIAEEPLPAGMVP